MTLMAQLKQDQLIARKNKDKVSATLLTTLIGEASMVGKSDGNRETTNNEVVAIIKKFIKNLNEVSEKAGNTRQLIYDRAQLEISILEKYLPQQLTESELRILVSDFIATNKPKSIGEVMKYLTTSYAGQFDGKSASATIKSMFG